MNAETAQRGYLLNSSKFYLERFGQWHAKVIESLRLLADVGPDMSAPDRDMLDSLRATTRTRLSELAQSIALYDAGKQDEAMQLALGDAGRAHIDSIRSLSAELLVRGRADVVQGREKAHRDLTLRRFGMAALGSSCMLAFFMYLRQKTALEMRQQEVQRLVQAERDRLEVEVAQRTAQLTELARHLQTAREDERNRLARNLHDDLGALLTSAKLDAARIKSRLADAAPQTLELLAHLVGTINSSIALGRRIIEDLRPSALGNLGLVAALEILTREFAEQSGVEVHCTLEPVRLAPAGELMVYRLVQEAITNISKYAQASHVWISLGTRAGRVEVSVRDDGVGFDTRVKPSSAYGLVGMRFRVEAEGGTLALVSAPGQGAQISVILPQSAPDTTPEAAAH